MDKQRLAYDLALVYAQERYRHALDDHAIDVPPGEPEVEIHAEFLASAFTSQYITLLNSPDLFSVLEDLSDLER